jgi:hypothetical protein
MEVLLGCTYLCQRSFLFPSRLRRTLIGMFTNNKTFQTPTKASCPLLSSCSCTNTNSMPVQPHDRLHAARMSALQTLMSCEMPWHQLFNPAQYHKWQSAPSPKPGTRSPPVLSEAFSTPDPGARLVSMPHPQPSRTSRMRRDCCMRQSATRLHNGVHCDGHLCRSDQ